jgi:hypothetical protein
MAIRMVDDPRDPDEYRDDNRGGGGRRPSSGGGGGGGLIQLLIPLLFSLFRKPGGLLILAILVGGYFMLNQGGCGSMFSESNASQFSTGGNLDPAQYAKAQVYEGLTEDDIRNPLPGYVSLARYAPPRLNQGRQGSCVAWSAAYGAHTILKSAATGQDPRQTAFSPAYLYNQIALQGCQGSYLERAMNAMSRRGSVPFNDFPYDENNCTRPVPTALNTVAAQNRIHGFNRLTGGEDVAGLSIRALKEHLAKGSPVVIGMMVGGTFMEGMMGRKVWEPTQRDYSQMGFGGHAMTVIGYDDKLAGGAFQIMNSWGPEWGENGIGWVRYGDFKEFTREAYGIDPLPKQGAENLPFDVEIGLVRVDDKAKPAEYIPIRANGSNNFTTTGKVAPGTRFKMEVKNNTPCYVYVFGRESDGRSYTLFPYPLQNDPTKTAYTPYCGITGYRLFPKDKSMTPDEAGNKDYMAVIVSNKELNWFQLNQKIDEGKSGAFTSAVSTALSSEGTTGRIQVSSTGKGNMKFAAPAGDNGIAWAVVEVIK